MNASRTTLRALAALATTVGLLRGLPAFAQVTPAAGYTPPDDTPSIKVGTTIFSDYTYTDEPLSSDTDGNLVHQAAFNVSRAYINVTGNVSHNVSFRVTPDITSAKSTGTTSTLDGSLVFRLKYAYGQFNLDEKWASKGSWVRFGEHHTPYVDWEEGVYRYRFQGQIFVERDGPALKGSFVSSSDFGVSTHYNFKGNYGDVHGGYYNGDTYKSTDVTDQKAVQLRATLRPLPTAGVLKGLRLTAFYDADNYFRGDARRRFIYAAVFEHKYVNAGFEHLDATDQGTAAALKVNAQGYSVWATPRFPKGWEALLRYDHLKPDKDVDAAKDRKIAGIAYWFKSQQAPATAAVLLDYENVTYDTALASQDEKRYAVHTLFNF